MSGRPVYLDMVAASKGSVELFSAVGILRG